ncbi:hypothetical protein ACF1BE_19635 [Streptomyces sp. NPDC014991]|uniref:hypothetical protein n=1 Tax=Streptomyces sp. NPDC014991 TaxID=3364935 RepID=UPI003701F617
MSVQPTEHPHTLTGSDLTAVNELAVRSMLDYLPLPAATLTPRPDTVHITVTSANDLSRWMYDLGGRIEQSGGTAGVALWTLHTTTPPRGDGSTVSIRVHATVVDGDDVLTGMRPGGTR